MFKNAPELKAALKATLIGYVALFAFIVIIGLPTV
jgi:hypothetical protein